MIEGLNDQGAFREKKEGQDLLSYEEFVGPKEGHPKFNNFFGFFEVGDFGELLYRCKDIYKRFQKDNPELCAELLQKMADRPREDERGRRLSTRESLEPLFPDLYRAYQQMRSYAQSDQELFGS